MVDKFGAENNDSSIKVWDEERGELVPVDEFDYDFDDAEYDISDSFYDNDNDDDEFDEYQAMSDEILEQEYQNHADNTRMLYAKDNFW